MGAHYLPETPISLIEQGHEEYTLVILKEIWGVDEEEFYDLIQAREASQQVKCLWRSIVTRKYKPQFFMSLPILFFQQITGMNALIFYAPFLFQSFGYGGHSSLMSALPLITALSMSCIPSWQFSLWTGLGDATSYCMGVFSWLSFR